MDFEHVLVVGAGQMGGGIAQVVAASGRHVSLFDAQPGAADRAVAALKKEFANKKIDTQDGIRIDWPSAWVHARPSNTEPIMRIIAEAPDRATANEKIAMVQRVVQQVLK